MGNSISKTLTHKFLFFVFTILENEQSQSYKHSTTELMRQSSKLAFKTPLICNLIGQCLSIFNPTLGLLTHLNNGTEATKYQTTSSTANLIEQFALANSGKVPKLLGTAFHIGNRDYPSEAAEVGTNPRYRDYEEL